ncbi:hypothetical protein [Endozoicomonas sp. 8E]|uniref:hypothetical protein n=1 Tax=Endozoicomonas sp. 8E TaxID=3035692 RepID=UPI002938ED14|nr:hypothetical protein [Endozoicomonas sp. 8E]WOG28411.1 hypothetical protein P6910_01795 [Endozoicomonas sp. 8E]
MLATSATPRLSLLNALENEYHEQFNQVLCFHAQHDFLNYIPDLKECLRDPSQFQDNLPFEIVYVKKDGKMTSVLPPDPELPTDSEKAIKLRESLQKKLTVIDQKNGPEEKLALRKQIENTEEKLIHISRDIEENGGTVPTPPIPKITLVIDENQFTARAPARPLNLGEAADKQSAEGQFLLIPKDASRYVPPPTPRPFMPFDIPDEDTSIRPTGPLEPHSIFVRPIERQLPMNPGGEFSDIYLTRETESDQGQTGNIASVNAGPIDLLFGEEANEINARFGEFFTSAQQEAIRKAQQDFLAKPEVEEEEGHSEIDEAEGHSEIDEAEGHPEIDEAEGHPEIEEDEGHSEIDEAEGHPEIEEDEGHSEVEEAEGLSEIVFSSKEFTDGTPLAAMYGFVTDETENQGTVLVNVFKDEHCPVGIRKNRAMIYVVPPNGSSDHFDNKDHFLQSVRLTAKNLVTTQNKYNHWAAREGHPTLPVLRTGVFVDDLYRHPEASEEEVADAIREGINDYFENISPDHNTIREVQYEYGL